MNPMGLLRTALERAYPEATLSEDRPLHEKGVWHLDLDYDKTKINIQWSPQRGFGVSKITLVNGYGEGPDIAVGSIDEAVERVHSIIRGDPEHRFVFHFYDDNEDATVYYEITSEQAAEIRRNALLDESHGRFLASMAKYGEHVFVTEGEEEVIGYDSHKVKPTERRLVVEMWRGYLAQRGWKPRQIVTLHDSDYRSKFFGD